MDTFSKTISKKSNYLKKFFKKFRISEKKVSFPLSRLYSESESLFSLATKSFPCTQGNLLSKDYAEKLVAEQCQIVEDKCKANIDEKQKEINDSLQSKLDLLLGNQGLQSQRFDSMDQSIQQLNTTMQAQQLQIQTQESQIQGLIATIQAQQADIHKAFSN
jgi:hypothetical protein